MLAHLVYKFVFCLFLSNRVCQVSSSNLANFFTLNNQKEFRSSREVEFSFSSLRSQTVILNQALFFEFQMSISTQFIPVFLFVLKQPKKVGVNPKNVKTNLSEHELLLESTLCNLPWTLAHNVLVLGDVAVSDIYVSAI